MFFSATLVWVYDTAIEKRDFKGQILSALCKLTRKIRTLTSLLAKNDVKKLTFVDGYLPDVFIFPPMINFFGEIFILSSEESFRHR